MIKLDFFIPTFDDWPKTTSLPISPNPEESTEHCGCHFLSVFIFRVNSHSFGFVLSILTSWFPISSHTVILILPFSFFLYTLNHFKSKLFSISNTRLHVGFCQCIILIHFTIHFNFIFCFYSLQMNSRTHPKSKTTNTAGQPASLSTVLPTTQQHPPVSSTSSVAAASQVAQSAMQQPQSHLQHSTTGPPSVNATTASGQNHSKPYYKKGGASGGGYNGKKSYCVNNFGNAGQSNYGGGGHMHSGAVAGNYHGQAHHMKPHTRDRHAQVAGSGNAYDSYTTTNSTTNSNYIKPCNNPNGGNSSSGPSYETFTKSKELGSTGSLSGSNCSATTNLSKSNSGSTTTGGGQKSNHQSGNWNHMNQWKSSRRNNNHSK